MAGNLSIEEEWADYTTEERLPNPIAPDHRNGSGYLPGTVNFEGVFDDALREALRDRYPDVEFEEVPAPEEERAGVASIAWEDVERGRPLDPIEVATSIWSALGRQAAPHYVMSPAHTFTFGPADEPVPADFQILKQLIQDSGEEFGQSDGRVLVIDTGMPTPKPAIIQDASPAEPEVTNQPYEGHGAFVAGIVRRRYPRLKLGVYCATDHAGVLTEDAVSNAIVRAVNQADGPTVINVSLYVVPRPLNPVNGLGPPPIAMPLILPYAIAHAWANEETLIVAAAGNEGRDRPVYPAGWADDPNMRCGVISVGALDNGDKAHFSNYGSWVSVWAPGVNILSCYPAGWRYSDLSRTAKLVFPAIGPNRQSAARWSGTSFAAPFVAGAIANQAQATNRAVRDVAKNVYGIC